MTLSAIFLHSVTSFAQEPRNLFFIWDIGATQGQGDSGDIILNNSYYCFENERLVNLRKLYTANEETLLQVNKTSRANYNSEAKSILKALGLESLDSMDRVQVYDYFKGSSDRVFILLPEVHSNFKSMDCTEDCKERHLNINANRSVLSLVLTFDLIAQGKKVSNLSEGTMGADWTYSDLALSGKTPMERYQVISQNLGITTPFLMLGNTFEGAGVSTSYLESYEILYKELLLTFSEISKESLFTDAKSDIGKFYDLNSIDLEKMEAVFNNLKILPDNQIQELKKSLCRVRSIEMATASLKHSDENQSSLTFFNFGAAHYKGITETLKARGQSYISLVGRSEF